MLCEGGLLELSYLEAAQAIRREHKVACCLQAVHGCVVSPFILGDDGLVRTNANTQHTR